MHHDEVRDGIEYLRCNVHLISPQMLLGLIFIAVVWFGLLAVYVLITAVDRVVEHLDTISKQINMTPQEKGAEP